MKIHILDHHFRDTKEAIGSYLIETSEGPILIESGPYSTYPQLAVAIQEVGYQPQDIQHVFLTHIHFDHAGAAWQFAALGAKIYVHEIGVPHLHNPEKLWNSAAQIYGDEMDALWGRMEPIPLELLVATADGDEFQIGEVKIKAIYTPGHAVHHNAYLIDNVLFTGDVGGVKIGDGPVVPPCPPPDINIELWKESIGKLRNSGADTFYLTHFGAVYNVAQHCDALEQVLDKWADFIKPYFEQNTPSDEVVPKFMAFTDKDLKAAGLDKYAIQQYQYANPSWMSVNGLLRYWKLKAQGRI